MFRAVENATATVVSFVVAVKEEVCNENLISS
jgi:hypothetical protein